METRRAPHIAGQIAFLEDNDQHMAPLVVSGVDLWLNLPRPPLEASGTSGIKVALNGGRKLFRQASVGGTAGHPRRWHWPLPRRRSSV